MRSKRRLNHRKINYPTIKTMAALLQRERHKHQVTVTELRAILHEERTEVNAFLKEMQNIIINMGHQWPVTAQNYHSRDVSRSIYQYAWLNFLFI